MHGRGYLAVASTCTSVDFSRIGHRFELLNEEELDNLFENADSKNTKRQLKFTSKVFSDFCAAAAIDDDRIADLKS